MPRFTGTFRLLTLAGLACACGCAAPVSQSWIDPISRLALLSLPSAQADIAIAPLMERGWSSGTLGLADLSEGDRGSAAPQPSDNLAVPILALVLAGAIWRYYHSPDYRRLYEALYGPLKEY